MVEQVLLYALGASLLNVFCIYCWFNLLGKSVNWKDIKIWFAILLMTIVATILNFLCPQPFRIIISCLFLGFVCYYTVKTNLKNSVILVLISQLIIMVSEFVFVSLGLCIYGNGFSDKLLTPKVSIVSNICITAFSFLILKTKVHKWFYKILSKSSTLMLRSEVLIYSIMIIVVAIVSTAESYMNLPVIIVLTTNTAMSLVFIFMVVKFASAKEQYYQMNSKYQTSISSLNEYGEILDKYRVTTHENKNQLLTIQKMTKDKNVIKYIDALLDEKIKDNEKIMNKTFKIPEGGFRSIIYAKLCKINELKIKYKLEIANEVKTVDLIDMDEMSVKDVCTVLGVYLDNAIEAVKDLKKRNVFIEIYIIDNYLCFDISNNYEGVLDAEKLRKPKYTTKGKGHGYGLTLVDKIDGENKEIKTECEISPDIITQRVKIKM